MENIIYGLTEIERSLIIIKKRLREISKLYEDGSIKEIESEVYLTELNLAGIISEITPTWHILLFCRSKNVPKLYLYKGELYAKTCKLCCKAKKMDSSI